MARDQSQSAVTAVSAALRDCRRAFWSVALFSAVVNLLMLAGPLYMLQIYDRVLTSGSVPTLVALSVFLVGAYAFQAVLDLTRSRVVVRVAALLDQQLGSVVHNAVARLAIRTKDPVEVSLPMRDLDQIRSFLTSSGPIAVVDLPWMPVFLFICWLIHPWLGVVAFSGGLALFALTILTERASRAPVRAVSRDGSMRAAMIESTRRNGETVAAMGMEGALASRWVQANSKYVAAVQKASDVVSSHSTISRVFRLLLQSALLGVGAYLVINQQLTAGAMIAASVMMGRALAPLETAIANWRGFVGARDSTRRLKDVLSRLETGEAATVLPRPRRSIDVEHLTIVPPGSNKPVVANVHFSLAAGEALGIIGPSGSGKTSLVRALVNVWPAARGIVRVDGAAFDHWRREELGRHIGYMAQAVELFGGTVAENIARMAVEPDHAGVIRAAQAAGVHEMILKLSAGYDTEIGEGGAVLSAGQRQRIALARSLYGDPFLIVLDEPGSNLDNDGDMALEQALKGAKEGGAIVIIVAHRPSALAACDKVLVLANGIQQAFGQRDEVLRKVTAKPALPAASAAANLRVVGEPSGRNG